MAYCSSIGHEFLAFLNRTWRPSTALEAGFSCNLPLADRHEHVGRHNQDD